MARKLQVLVVFEFGGIESADSPEADIAVDEVTEIVTGIMATEWQVPATTITGWVQDATVVEDEEDEV
jgi:hypothetical protein